MLQTKSFLSSAITTMAGVAMGAWILICVIGALIVGGIYAAIECIVEMPVRQSRAPGRYC